MDAPKCQAHTTAGNPCKNPAIRGATVCRSHGGSAPQVKAAAQRRLLEAVDPLIAELIRIGLSGKAEQVRVSAIKEALERAGFGEKRRVEVTHITEDVLDAEIARLVEELETLDG